VADTPHRTLEPRRTESDLVVSAADLLAGRASPDEAIVLLDRLLTADHGLMSPVGAESEPADCLLWHAPLAVVQLWPDRWVARSAAFSRVLGHPPEASHGHGPLAFVHSPDRGIAMRAYVETSTGRRARSTVLLRVRTAEGALRLFETMFVGSSTATGRPSVVVYAQDLTGWHGDRVRSRVLVPRLDHGMMVIDEAGCVRLTNDTLTCMFGPRTGRWTEQREVLRWLVASCRDVPLAGQQVAALAAAPEHSALRLHLADGRTVHIDRTPVTDADLPLGAVWRFWEVSEPVGAQDTRRPVEHAVPGVHSRVLATVSHDLNAIARLAGVLSDRRTRPSRQDWRAAAEAIACDTRRALTVVDDLLLLSQLDSGQLSLRKGEVRVPELVRSVVAARIAEAKAAGVVLTCRTGRGPTLAGDEDRLRQVLDNLIHNAVKFSKKGGTTNIVARPDGPQWTIVVADRGIGIPAADLERVTRGLERGANAVAKLIPGNGLGLGIARQLVELHHGTLTVQSTVDVGTTVRVSLPVRDRTR
jgi:signal transduction histidine kinase